MAKLDEVIADFFRRLDAGEGKAYNHMAKAYEQVLRAYDAEMSRILKLIEADGPTASRQFQYQRLQALAAQAADAMAGYGGTLSDVLRDVQQSAGAIAYQSSASLIEAVAPSTFASYATLPESAVERMVGSLQDGSPLRSLTGKYGADSGRLMNRLLLEGVALGRSPLETARLMRDGLGISHSRAKTLVRTEQMRVFREVNRQRFIRSSVVKGWKWFAVLDRLSCPVCWSMHGKQFDKRQRMETHPNCRCVMLPVTKTFEELGIAGVNEPPAPSGFAQQSRKGRLSNGFQFTASDTLNRRGEVLFDSLPTADKQRILGKTAYRAYESNLVKLSDFVQETNNPLWGRGKTTRPLSSILGRERARALQNQVMGRATAVAKPVTRPVPQTKPVPAPVVQQPKPPAQWKPNMTRAEADAWAQQGDLSRPLFHTTNPDGEVGITANGFDLNRGAWGRVWGNGAYMSDTTESYEMYKQMFSDPRRVELRVFSRKTYVKNISGVPEGTWGHTNFLEDIPGANAMYQRNLINIQGHNAQFEGKLDRLYGTTPSQSGLSNWEWYSKRDDATKAAVQAGEYVNNPSAEAFTRTLRDDLGYDAIEIIDEPHRQSVGGSQVIVFDPKRVTVVKD
jgi:SPP1 gp7 family putative phage head morphogenesis protein